MAGTREAGTPNPAASASACIDFGAGGMIQTSMAYPHIFSPLAASGGLSPGTA